VDGQLAVTVLADLADPIGPDAVSPVAMACFELMDALDRSASDIGGFGLDCVARPGSIARWSVIPAGPDGPAEGGAAPSPAAGWQEAAYTRLILAGAFDRCSVVHCLAPLTSALELLVSRGVPCLSTVPAREDARHGGEVLQVTANEGLAARHDVSYVPLSVDVMRFRPAPRPRRDAVVCLGEATADLRAHAEAAFGLPVVGLTDGDPADRLAHAAAVIEPAARPAPLGPGWVLRALACGVPVGAFAGSGLAGMLESAPHHHGVVVPDGDGATLAARLAAVAARDGERARNARRQLVLARHNRRLTAARYRKLYQTVMAACTHP
jgi:hypothetical protein